MDEIVKVSVEAPTERFLDQCTKDQLVKIAEYYSIDVGDKRVKETVKANLKVKYLKMKVLGTAEAASFPAGAEDSTSTFNNGSWCWFDFSTAEVVAYAVREEREVVVEKRNGLNNKMSCF